MAEWTHIDGENKGEIRLYALSTCGWCKKTKRFLNQLGVEYSYIDVDKLSKQEKNKIQQEVKRWNPMCSYPTIVLWDEKAVIGFDDDKLRKELEK
jgi:glutaredoxin